MTRTTDKHACVSKSSVMAVLGCNGLRCVIKIILSLSACVCVYADIQVCIMKYMHVYASMCVVCLLCA